MILVITGTNATGKSTLAKRILGKNKRVLDHGFYKVTFGNDWVAFGSYVDAKKMTGADLESENFTKKLEHFLEKYRDYDCLVEGLLTGSGERFRVYKTFQDRVAAIILSGEYPELLLRLYKRNGRMKRYRNVLAKKEFYDTIPAKLKEMGIPLLYLDTTRMDAGMVYGKVMEYINGIKGSNGKRV